MSWSLRAWSRACYVTVDVTSCYILFCTDDVYELSSQLKLFY